VVISQDELAALTADLVAIDSTNPDLVGGGGETIGAVEAEIAVILERASATDPGFCGEQRTLLVRESFSVVEEEGILQLARSHVAGTRGVAPALGGAGGWMDSAILAAAGIPTVVFGPDGAGAHADEEWVDLASAVLTAQALLGIAMEFCG
jgi:acetylornithine deacetylase